MTMTNGKGRLALQVLLPTDFTVTKIGGKNFRYYVEDDGDDSDGFDGRNHDDYRELDYHDVGDWRIEISPKAARTADVFLNVLAPAAAGAPAEPAAELLVDDARVKILQTGAWVVAFAADKAVDRPFAYQPRAGATRHLLTGLVPSRPYRIAVGAEAKTVSSNAAGVILFDVPAGAAGRITVSPAE
jgi:hypothetical protein